MMLKLREQIVENNLDNYYIVLDGDSKILNIYINQIAEQMGIRKKTIENSTELLKDLRKGSLFSERTLYIIRDDNDYTKDLHKQDAVRNRIGENIVMFIYSTLDKRSKMYKNNKLTVFEHMSPKMLCKHIKEEIDITDRGADLLAQICNDDYGQILLEVDKIKLFTRTNPMSPDMALDTLLRDGTIYTPAQDAIFNFIDAVMYRDKANAYRLYDHCKRYGEANMVLVSVLYTTIRRTMLVQACNSGRIEETTGLSAWDVKCAKKHVGYYDTIELVNALKLVRGIELGIKTGQIADEYSIDYILVNMF